MTSDRSVTQFFCNKRRQAKEKFKNIRYVSFVSLQMTLRGHGDFIQHIVNFQIK